MKKEQECGALWAKTSGNGKRYFSGKLDWEKIKEANGNVVLFPNGYKKEEKHPDYLVYIQEPQTRMYDQDSGEQYRPSELEEQWRNQNGQTR